MRGLDAHSSILSDTHDALLLCAYSLWDRKFLIGTGRKRFNKLSNGIAVRLNARPRGSTQYENGEVSAGDLLLVFEVLIGRNEDVEARLFGAGE